MSDSFYLFFKYVLYAVCNKTDCHSEFQMYTYSHTKMPNYTKAKIFKLFQGVKNTSKKKNLRNALVCAYKFSHNHRLCETQQLIMDI